MHSPLRRQAPQHIRNKPILPCIPPPSHVDWLESLQAVPQQIPTPRTELFKVALTAVVVEHHVWK